VRTCSKCKIEKNISDFYKRNSRISGVFSECKLCNNKRSKEYKKKNLEKVSVKFKEYYLKNIDKIKEYNRSEKRKNVEFKNRYGITLDQRNKLFENQGGKCLTCLTTKAKKFCVDHCHKSGKIRGILCDNCNKAIGLIKDKKETAYRIFNYLMKE
jgi:hypothetical protein